MLQMLPARHDGMTKEKWMRFRRQAAFLLSLFLGSSMGGCGGGEKSLIDIQVDARGTALEAVQVGAQTPWCGKAAGVAGGGGRSGSETAYSLPEAAVRSTTHCPALQTA